MGGAMIVPRGETKLPRLKLELAHFRSKLYAGLIEKGGRRTRVVEIIVPPGLLDNIKEAASGSRRRCRLRPPTTPYVRFRIRRFKLI